MSANYSVDGPGQVVTLALHGEILEADVERMLVAVLDVTSRRGFNFLIDWRDLTKSPSAVQVKRFVDWVEAHHDQLGLCRWAILGTPGTSFGMARMADLLAARGHVEAQGFHDESDAVRWVSHPCAPSTRDGAATERDAMPAV